MGDQTVRVECYAGYKGDERPIRLHLAGCSFDVLSLQDRWYSPGATFFRVVVDGGDHYVLRHEEAQDVWYLSAFRAVHRQTRQD